MPLFQDLKTYYKQADAVQKIIFWNVFLFVIPMLINVFAYFFNTKIDFLNWVALPSHFWNFVRKPYTLLTYLFFHSDFLHLLFNLIWLYFVSQLFRTFFSEKKLIGVYFLGGIFSGIFYVFLHTIIPVLSTQNNWLVGSSGAVMAVFFATVSYNPSMNVRLALIGTVKIWHIAVVFIILDVLQIPSSNTGGHLAHLGGAMFGYFYMKLLQNGTDISQPFQTAIDKFLTIFQPKKKQPFKKIYKNTSPKKTHETPTKDQQIIDDILDKISQSGYESLTQNEKDFLFKFGK